MKESKSKSTDCRHLSKDYLGCRMDKYVLSVFPLARVYLPLSWASLAWSGEDPSTIELTKVELKLLYRGLMDRVDWGDLGFQDGEFATAKSKHPIPDKPTKSSSESHQI
jgi:hypothetical protein